MGTKKTSTTGQVKTSAAAKKKSAKKQTPPNPPVNGGGQKKQKQKRKANPALMKPQKVTPELAAIVGTKPLSRGKIVEKVWEYIKANGCQDRENRRMVNPSGLLVPVLGSEQVSMFKLTALVSKHVLGAADAVDAAK